MCSRRVHALQIAIVIIIITNLKQNESQSARRESTTRELISALNTQHKYSKDLSRLRYSKYLHECQLGENYRRRRRSLLLCYAFRALINSLVCLILLINGVSAVVITMTAGTSPAWCILRVRSIDPVPSSPPPHAARCQNAQSRPESPWFARSCGSSELKQTSSSSSLSFITVNDGYLCESGPCHL